MEEGYSYGYNNARDAVSLTPRRQVVPLLLPDEFMGLPSLEGYIKFPDGFAAAPVTLTPRNWPRIAEGFVARDTSRKPPPADTDEPDEPDGKGGAGGGDGPPEAGEAGGRERGVKARPASTSRGDRKAQKTAKRGSRRADRRSQHDKDPARITDPVKANRREDLDKIGSFDRPAQGSLPLPDKAHDKDPSLPAARGPRRSDVPDPEAQQRSDKDRNQADRRLQEEQQRGLLGGAARDQPDHDLGDYEM
ncbi:hypothetical protein GCM10023208_30410 [Erythrobacter westpacificensis]|uniref:Type IV secretion system coupling protein TraD DNA-binding domain-containing protein n=1 Tax=Erythrobacter westpacificensis TaxID=1055231 RepID=A0ABP9KP85_9SPHN